MDQLFWSSSKRMNVCVCVDSIESKIFGLITLRLDVNKIYVEMYKCGSLTYGDGI